MAAGSGHQNIRRVEDQAIAKADRYSKRMHTDNSINNAKRDNKRYSDTDVWRYKLVDGKWQKTDS